LVDSGRITQLGIVLALALFLLSIFSKFVPQLSFFKPTIMFLFIAVMLMVYIAFTLVQRSFILKREDYPSLIIVSGIVVFLLLFGFGVIGGDFFKASIIELQSLLGVI